MNLSPSECDGRALDVVGERRNQRGGHSKSEVVSSPPVAATLRVKNEMMSPPPSDSGDRSRGAAGTAEAVTTVIAPPLTTPHYYGVPPPYDFSVTNYNTTCEMMTPPPTPQPLSVANPAVLMYASPPATSVPVTPHPGAAFDPYVNSTTADPSTSLGAVAASPLHTGYYDPSDPSNYFEPANGGQNPSDEESSQGIKAVVEEQGYISLHLRYDAQVDISPTQAIRIVNRRQRITLALSSCATQMALVHPQGRVLQYNSRIEVQTENYPSIKNAKMWPRGVSFTANNCALVYLVDQAGARSTTDTFHDLYTDNIADSVFMKSCQMSADNYATTIEKSIRDLERADYWRTDSNLDCWLINNVNIQQTPDGLVSVERRHGLEKFTLKTSPSNGKARLQSSFLYLTASMGEESHIFIRSNDRRIHYNGTAFVVRNAGHSAGFDDKGQLRIW